jgi:hypothetical protein
VGAYSLTQLRLAALVWMGLVGVGLMLICWRLLKAKSGGWLVNANAAAAGLVLAAFCFIDTAAICADWNTRHAREAGGHGAALDLYYLRTLGPSSLVALTRLEALQLDPAFRQRVHVVRTALLEDLVSSNAARGGWTTWRARRILAQARNLAAGLAPVTLTPGRREFDGSLIQVVPPARAKPGSDLPSGHLTGGPMP